MNWQKIKSCVMFVISILYIPFYLAFFLLHKLARILLAIAYLGMFQKRMAIDILSNIFSVYGWRRI